MRLIIIFFMFTNNILAEEIIGIPRIIDGDTVHINNFKIRLEGIDAPEIKQKCKKKKQQSGVSNVNHFACKKRVRLN